VDLARRLKTKETPGFTPGAGGAGSGEKKKNSNGMGGVFLRPYFSGP